MDVRRKGKDNLKKAEAENMREKIDDYMKSRKSFATQTLHMKKELTEKNQQCGP